MDKLCAKCGKHLQPEQGFCDQCGYAWTPTIPASTAIPPQPAQKAAVPASGRGSGRTIGVVAILAVIGFGIAAYFFVTRQAVAAPPPVTTTSTRTVATVSATTTTAAVEAPPPVTDIAATSSNAVSVADKAIEDAAGSKPCSLITRAEIGQILDSQIVKVTNTEHSCAYFTDDTKSAQVETTWTGGKDAMKEIKGFNSGEGLMSPIAGLGDEAFLQAAGVLHVLKGDTYVVINAREYPHEQEIETAVARVIMEKIK